MILSCIEAKGSINEEKCLADNYLDPMNVFSAEFKKVNFISSAATNAKSLL